MIESFADVYLQVGAVGFCLILFGFMILNLIKSQKEQSDQIEEIRQDIAKIQTVASNHQGISIKLIDKINDFKDDLFGKIDRKADVHNESLGDVEKTLNRMDGMMTRMNGKNG